MKKFNKILAAAVLSMVAISGSYALDVDAAGVDLTEFNKLNVTANDKTVHPELVRGSNKKITNGVYDQKMAVKCFNGTFVGKDYGDCQIWRGIPFAQPPVGELRWKKPLAPQADNGIYEAYTFAKKPLQLFDQEENSEDCLYLNVYKGPEDGVKNKPVMVWIHGGGFLAESASDDLYRGEKFIKANPDVILVTVEYRLGAVGWMDFSQVPGGENYKEAGVLGSFDQIAALKWVNKNIKKFGGDPKNVTIFGESAGSVSCNMLPLFKESKGLFQKIIAQSGSLDVILPPGTRRHITQNLLDLTGAKNMEDLKKVPSEVILENYMTISGGPRCFSPIKDNVYLPHNTKEMYDRWAKNTKDIIVMMGANSDEARYCMSTWMGLDVDQAKNFFENSYKLSKSKLPKEAIAIAENYLASLPDKLERYEKLERLYTQMSFRQGAATLADISPNKNKVYVYEFTPAAQADYAGSFHAAEVEYLFNHKDRLATFGRNDSTTHKIADQLQKVWVNFAKTGVPSLNGKAFKPWGNDSNTFVFEKNGDIVDVPNFKAEDTKLLTPLRPYAGVFIFDGFDLDPNKANPDYEVK